MCTYILLHQIEVTANEIGLSITTEKNSIHEIKSKS